jgi:hypothetical protein
MNRHIVVFLGLLAFFAFVLAAEGNGDPDIDPKIQERLNQAKMREEIEKKYREGVKQAQKV